MLGKAEDIPIRILEPRHACTIGRSPDSQIILLHEVMVTLEGYSRITKGLDNSNNICNLPAHDGKGLRFYFAYPG